MDGNLTHLAERSLAHQALLGSQALLGNGSGSPDPGDPGDPGSDPGDLEVNTDLYSKLAVTVIYAALFCVGCVGNSVTLYTLLSRRSLQLQHLQSTVHYHLASLAASDLLILVLCMPVELYNFIWVHHPWVFGDAACRGYYFLRDGCAYATALNIGSLSAERYLAICHPFKAKSVTSRSRTKRLIGALWLGSFLLATPMLFVMGQVTRNGDAICTATVTPLTLKTVLQVNALLSFVVPMVAISVLNGVIANQLLRMFREAEQDRRPCAAGAGNPSMFNTSVESNRAQSLRHGVLVLRAVVIAFVVCWLPYHARRLMFCYVTDWSEGLFDFYHYFYMLTNVLFYVSSAINPVLYNLVSASYRQVFFSTLRCLLLPCPSPRQRPPPLTRHSISISSNHTLSTHVVRETAY